MHNSNINKHKKQKNFLLKNCNNKNLWQLHTFTKMHRENYSVQPLINFKIALSYNLTK